MADTIKPIWKKKDSRDDPTKYLGITITSTVNKVFKYQYIPTKKTEPP